VNDSRQKFSHSSQALASYGRRTFCNNLEHMMLLRALFFIVLATPVFAANDFCRELKERYDLPQRLVHLEPRDKESYYQQLEAVFNLVPAFKTGWVDSKQIIREIRSIRLCVNATNTPLTGSGSRHGSVYFTKERIIVLNRDRILERNGSPENALLLIHETLGALGYPDENYQLTSLVYAHAQREEFGHETVEIMRVELGKELQTQTRRIENVVSRESTGGISGVGGGGDPEVAFFKPSMTAMLLYNPDFFGPLCGGVANLPSVARFIMSSRLETDDAVIFPRVDSSYPHLFIAYTNKELFIQIEHAAWTRLRERGAAAYDERNIFIRNLTLLSCVLAKNP
jgi:hypothetical protein